MSTETVEQFENLAAPYGRQVKLEDVTFESGMCLLRITIREGRRFTILDVDAATAGTWGAAMSAWAARQQDRPQD